MTLRIFPLVVLGLALISTSCAPLRSSPSDGQHVFELTLHEVQTNLDDLRHDINCFQSEMQILEGRIKSHEHALAYLREQGFEKQQARLDQLSRQIQAFEKSWDLKEKGQTTAAQELKQLSVYANETTLALNQFKKRILELETDLAAQNRRFEELSKIKETIESVVNGAKPSNDPKLYRVKPGDTLEKIARLHQTTVEKLKKANKLELDTIAIGQQLKIPPNE